MTKYIIANMATIKRIMVNGDEDAVPLPEVNKWNAIIQLLPP